MIQSDNLRDALKPWVLRFEEDLLQRTKKDAELLAPFTERYQEAKDGKRTSFTFNIWFEGERTQIAVAWVLSCVFARFLEDNDLIETPYLAGPGDRLQAASDQHVLYFRENPSHTERDYLLHLFTELAQLPALTSFFDAAHNPLWQLGPSGELCREFIFFWRKQHEESGNLEHDFVDPEWQTRFLGDLYQDLSEAARKRFALLQTPDFVEEFILDRTLTPAIETFGFREVRLIDPTCGSGHFLLGAFERLFAKWLEEEPGENPRSLTQKALDGVYGVDLNPFAVSIARFRLLIAALKACGDVQRLRNAPAFQINLAVGDSLLHGRRFRSFEGEETRQEFLPGDEEAFHDETKHFYEVENQEELHRILGQQYHAVVANPPYITVKDKALNKIYRKRYDTCYRKYALSVPFMERIFDLCILESEDGVSPAGFTGQITANSFMKREFGTKLIRQQVGEWDLNLIIDTSGAYIPGHGTPTVLLFGRNRRPTLPHVQLLSGIRGEPKTPENPREGLVWKSIISQLKEASPLNLFIEVQKVERNVIKTHPWILTELGRRINERFETKLAKKVEVVGFGAILGEDEAFLRDLNSHELASINQNYVRSFVEGTRVRDWNVTPISQAIFPYNESIELVQDDSFETSFWFQRSLLGGRKAFSGTTYLECGRPFWEYHQIPIERNQTPLSITFAFVATHNHFVLDRGGKVFNRSAPVVKLPAGASEEDHLRLLGPLNSSTACFWMKQVFHNKGSTVDSRGARQTTDPFEISMSTMELNSKNALYPLTLR